MFISTLLMVNNNEYQRSKYLTFENEIVGKVYSVADGISSYIGLRTTNRKLMQYISSLETNIQVLEYQLKESNLKLDTTLILSDSTILPFEFIPARILNKNISSTENYITLNKGSNHGVESDMGVLGTPTGGVVGVIWKVSPNFSVVIPVLNSKFRLSCKIKGNNYPGPLVWDRRDIRYATLEELPRHVETHAGDTVVTSGNSAIFPEGIPVGTVDETRKQKNDNFNSIKVRLLTDIGDIDHVLVVKNNFREEQLKLEKETENVN
jgi:rod shape-determining protein MreC